MTCLKSVGKTIVGKELENGNPSCFVSLLMLFEAKQHFKVESTNKFKNRIILLFKVDMKSKLRAEMRLDISFQLESRQAAH